MSKYSRINYEKGKVPLLKNVPAARTTSNLITKIFFGKIEEIYYQHQEEKSNPIDDDTII